ncbi:MAG: thioredoxin family protein [Actinomycetia bacterium]|nr:thioredoxin family protein [Actinomycetes bacterium]
MALTSSLVPLGTAAPDFTVPDVGGAPHSLGDFTAPVLVVAFVCNHCPYVKHIELAFGRIKATDQVAIVAISSNDVERYPEDAPPQLAGQAERSGWTFPYLVDTDQSVAKAYGAVCTPDFFVYGPDRRLAYRGAFDASTPGNGESVTGADLTNAIALVAAGQPVPEPHRPSMGCGIKWLPDNEQAEAP